jgi:tRNA threonylcarbamoyladenosine biosynthesis protein TsaB
MRILAIETTGPFASVALADESGRVDEIRSDRRMKHLEGLTAMIAELLAARALSLCDIDCVAASEGPGSFTGIRIGVSTARALAQATGRAALGVPTLASFVYDNPDYGGAVCPVFDARREELYSGVFRLGADGGPVTLIDGAARTPAALRRAIEGIDWDAHGECARAIRFFGDGIEACGDMLAGLRGAPDAALDVELAPPESRFQKAARVARLALFMLQCPPLAPAAPATTSPGGLLPVYMRLAEAERRLADAQKTQIPQNA